MERSVSFRTYHSRDYVKSTVSKHTTKDLSEWLLGHSGSTYWNIEEDETKELYLKCMKYLTFLDYETIEVVGADFESKLQERDKEIDQLKDRMEELEIMYLKAMAEHVVMESDLDSKGRTRRKIIKN